ncbi:hypothetical protein K0M31_004416 [Melipona bicolor]|uniref:Uncharacterized protein n=1 Tax=Melipona bicolor TaxID=60889 RepID=A0AA40FWR6_9HYME|nr:hypothetical protein K0M31_004416 [Melipona bicolor]
MKKREKSGEKEIIKRESVPGAWTAGVRNASKATTTTTRAIASERPDTTHDKGIESALNPATSSTRRRRWWPVVISEHLTAATRPVIREVGKIRSTTLFDLAGRYFAIIEMGEEGERRRRRRRRRRRGRRRSEESSVWTGWTGGPSGTRISRGWDVSRIHVNTDGH